MKLLIPGILTLLIICVSVSETAACLQVVNRLAGEQIKVDGVSAEQFVKNPRASDKRFGLVTALVAFAVYAFIRRRNYR